MKRITLRQARQAFDDRVPFQCNRTLRGIVGPPRNYGMINVWWLRHLKQFELFITYTAMSYDTPIAWVLSDGRVIVPPVKYSPTTSRHLSSLGLRWSEPVVEVVAA